VTFEKSFREILWVQLRILRLVLTKGNFREEVLVLFVCDALDGGVRWLGWVLRCEAGVVFTEEIHRRVSVELAEHLGDGGAFIGRSVRHGVDEG